MQSCIAIEDEGEIAVNLRANLPASPRRRPTRAGVSIIEVVFAILITSIGLLGAIALFPVALAQARKGLQYDAAANENVARQLAPNSQVAGKATVFVFPDLNTGNTTHKAVQRSADCVSLGPMLQGLRKPVNDLPRGAQVDDIVYTIALTAIQAANRPMDV